MAVSRASLGVVAIIAIFFADILQVAQAQSPSPAPTPTSDGTSIDQGIAYVLMLLALGEVNEFLEWVVFINLRKWEEEVSFGMLCI
ncbi:arabinogalactan peptide 20-like [Fagus crenata]